MRTRLILALVLALCACGGDDGGDGGGDTDAGSNPGDPFSVELVTTAGNFTIDVTPEWSPNGAARFRELVEAGFYDGNRFFRVVPGFIVQWGINGSPATHAMWSGQAINDDPVVESNLRGFVTFAKTNAPNSRTTQLFINYSDNSFLDSMGFSPFGEVVTGLENVDAINDEYGEEPSQGQLASEGNSYLDDNFPNLDSITTARVVP
ncbi:MAG: peptidylprolyl isomerase [Deltaproteobacteria bacterium]|nr:peptidylprolyl isomerase [Deltaproteobacteria bacterium]